MEQKKQTIGEQVFSQRKKAGLSQKALASKSSISLFTIASLEQERLTETSTHTLRALSKVFNFYKFEL